MAFRKLLKKLAPIVSTVGPMFGPMGIAAGAVSGLLASRGAPSMPAALPGGAPSFFPSNGAPTGLGMALPTAGFPQVAGILPAMGAMGRMLPSVGGLFGGGAGLIAGAGRAAVGLIRTAAGKIRGVMLASGRFISSKKASQLARRVGIDAAAVALGVSAVELAEMVLSEAERAGRRRGRGVSGADLRRTRRTIRTIERMHDQIVRACRDAMPARRRAPVVIAPHRHKLISVK